MKDCGPVNIPSVDNDCPKCDPAIKDTCVFVSRPYPSMEVDEGDPLDLLLSRYNIAILRLQQTVSQLKDRIEQIEQNQDNAD